jgi:hypothetical protein
MGRCVRGRALSRCPDAHSSSPRICDAQSGGSSSSSVSGTVSARSRDDGAGSEGVLAGEVARQAPSQSSPPHCSQTIRASNHADPTFDNPQGCPVRGACSRKIDTARDGASLRQPCSIAAWLPGAPSLERPIRGSGLGRTRPTPRHRSDRLDLGRSETSAKRESFPGAEGSREQRPTRRRSANDCCRPGGG